MPPALPLLYLDYLDPVSFLVETRVAALESDREVGVERRPFEAVPPPSPLLSPTDTGWIDRWETAAAVARAEGLELVRPSLLPWTRKAHELALHAREEGRFEAVHQALFKAFHLDGRDLGRVDVLVEIAVETGLDRTATRVVLDVDRYLETLRSLRIDAERRGVRGVPTIVAGGDVVEAPLDPSELRDALAP
jgi:predicted DsbA family dithiol-disulfide isomerase